MITMDWFSYFCGNVMHVSKWHEDFCGTGLVYCVSENVALPGCGYGRLRSLRVPPATWGVARGDGAGRARCWPESGSELHPFLVRTAKRGYLSAATSIQPIASWTWARFFFSIIFSLSFFYYYYLLFDILFSWQDWIDFEIIFISVV